MSREFDVISRYTGAGNKNDYTFDFKISGDNSDLLILKMKPTGEVVFKVRGTDTTYIDTVVMNDNNEGGTINLKDDLESGYILAIVLAPDSPEQDDLYRNQADFSLRKLENSLDQQNGYIQRLAAMAKRTPRAPDNLLSSEVDPELPADSLINGDGKYIQVKIVDGVLTFTLADGLDASAVLAEKEDRTLEDITPNDGQQALTSDSKRTIRILEDSGKWADITLPSVLTLNKGRSFVVHNLSTQWQGVYAFDYGDSIIYLQPNETALFFTNSTTDDTPTGWEMVRYANPETLAFRSSDFWTEDTDYTTPASTRDRVVNGVNVQNNASIKINLPSRSVDPGRMFFVFNSSSSYTHMIQYPESGPQWLIRPNERMVFINDPQYGWIHLGMSNETYSGMDFYGGNRYQRFTNVFIDVDDFASSPAYGLQNLVKSFLGDDVKIDYLTADRVPYLDSSKILQASAITQAELEALTGITGNVETRLSDLESSGITFPIMDTTFSLKSNTDATRIAKFVVGNTTTGTNTTQSLPPKSSYLVGMGSGGNNSPTFNLTSGSVTYQNPAFGNYCEMLSIKNCGAFAEVTAHVSIKLTAISSPVNTALSIPMTIAPSSGVSGFKPSAAVRCDNCTLTGQLFVFVEYGSSNYKLKIVNNGTMSDVSAASFLTANSELHFTITYMADVQ